MATPLAAIHAGAKVVFVDVMPENLSIDPDDLRRKITNDTAGVILVHIGGIISPQLHEIKKICEENGLFLIEDAAHAHGSSIKGKKAGTLGLCGSFSFYPTKVLNTAEGGMITTDDNTIFEKSLVFREHGKKDHNFNIHTELGYNWRFSELHALLGLQQMKIVNDIISKRQQIARFYDEKLNQVNGITLVKIPDYIECSYYKYIFYLDKKYNRDEIKNRLKKEYNILLPGEVYVAACHKQPVFQKHPNLVLNNSVTGFPGAEYVSKHQICLPLYPDLKDEELEYVVDCLKKVI
jgi:dTDP-4-amino-4,6-dideoxygalactose transaminase